MDIERTILTIEIHYLRSTKLFQDRSFRMDISIIH
jgi:hypothetical protein